MEDMLAFGKQVLESQPFSVLLCAELTELSAGKAELRIPITDQLMQQHGFVHGGVISYAVDNALTFAGGTVLGPMVVTSEYKINYVAPAKGGSLVARAIVLHSGTRQAVCRCDVSTVTEEGERLCATSQGTISRLGSSL
jgi:uncharacterized protein (TIGR00369 family)